MVYALLILCLIVVAATLSKVNGSKRRRTASSTFTFRTVLSRPEQVLYFRLVQALPEFVILSQVQVSRCLKPSRGSGYRSALNTIDRKSVDFLVCRKDFTVVVAIELDDATHQRPERRVADSVKDAAFASASLQVIRWNVASVPDAMTIRRTILGEAPALMAPAVPMDMELPADLPVIRVEPRISAEARNTVTSRAKATLFR